ncbi:MAG: hypothetical protein FJW30_14080 [Acidobacteria bacterium]|nr:hypothetical protein [Acidobacteriota bacterium]
MKLASSITAVALLTSVYAADPPPLRRYARVATYEVKPGMNLAFEDYLKNRYLPATRKGGENTVIHQGTSVTGNNNTYQVTVFLDSLARFDSESPFRKGAGEDWRRILDQRDALIERGSAITIRTIADLSVPQTPGKVSPLQIRQHVRVRGDKRAEWEEVWKSVVVPAVKKAGRWVVVSRVAFGADVEFRITAGTDTFAELDKGHTIAALSLSPEEYSAFNKRVGPMVESQRREVLRRRTDLMGQN